MRLVGPDQVRKLLTELADRLDQRIHADHAEREDEAPDSDRVAAKTS
jgi:hypothetical protein